MSDHWTDTVPGIVGDLASDTLTGLLNERSNRRSRDWAERMWHNQLAAQRQEMQWRVQDLRAAGLSPTLAVGGPRPPTTPNVPGVPPGAKWDIGSTVDAAMKMASIANIKQQSVKTKEEAHGLQIVNKYLDERQRLALARERTETYIATEISDYKIQAERDRAISINSDARVKRLTERYKIQAARLGVDKQNIDLAIGRVAQQAAEAWGLDKARAEYMLAELTLAKASWDLEQWMAIDQPTTGLRGPAAIGAWSLKQLEQFMTSAVTSFKIPTEGARSETVTKIDPDNMPPGPTKRKRSSGGRGYIPQRWSDRPFRY